MNVHTKSVSDKNSSGFAAAAAASELMKAEVSVEVPELARTGSTRCLVNPVAVQNCIVKWNDLSARVLDISFVRLVIEELEPWPAIPEDQNLNLDFFLGGYTFSAALAVQGRGDGWIRLRFEKIVPSSRSHLRSFLSPKKVGESIAEDRRMQNVRHYHGLNECELWFDEEGAVLFTYMDQADPNAQFLLQVRETNAPLQVGKISRQEYIQMESLKTVLPLVPMSDRENYSRMSECRDIVTNFRPAGEREYHLKQRLLKSISESLYSTSHRVERNPKGTSGYLS